MNLSVSLDDRFQEYFKNLLQVFMYVTDNCNLRCEQCYYKPWLKKENADMDEDVLLALLRKFRKMGAVKLSLLGGEPTLYGTENDNRKLPSILLEARKMGYEYIRVVTNGLNIDNFLDTCNINNIDELTFSIDGDIADIHDNLRGKGTYIKTVNSLKKAVNLGFNVQITTCVHCNNIGKDDKGNLLIDRAVHWAESLNVNTINFHPIFKQNIPRDSWRGDTEVSPQSWIKVYEKIHKNIESGKYSIDVRLPMQHVTKKEFQKNPKFYGYCPVKIAERIEVHSNGQIHSCALNNGTPISLAKFERVENSIKIKWSDINNELDVYPFDLSKEHPCAVYKYNDKSLVPLCISFKPNQNEFIWKKTGLS